MNTLVALVPAFLFFDTTACSVNSTATEDQYVLFELKIRSTTVLIVGTGYATSVGLHLEFPSVHIGQQLLTYNLIVYMDELPS